MTSVPKPPRMLNSTIFDQNFRKFSLKRSKHGKPAQRKNGVDSIIGSGRNFGTQTGLFWVSASCWIQLLLSFDVSTSQWWVEKQSSHNQTPGEHLQKVRIIFVHFLPVHRCCWYIALELQSHFPRLNFFAKAGHRSILCCFEVEDINTFFSASSETKYLFSIRANAKRFRNYFLLVSSSISNVERGTDSPLWWQAKKQRHGTPT